MLVMPSGGPEPQRGKKRRVPALVVCGDADKPVPLENASTILAERILDAQLVVVKDAGHFPHMEKPEIVNEAMWQWLRERVPV
jgi:pimeloyl-ACP methyl ester carboxylesterase